MGQFTITLPNNQQGNVRWGTIRKKTFFLNLFRHHKLKSEEKKGYIVKIAAVLNSLNEYRLLKTKEGEWASEGNEGFQVTPDDEMSIAIKKAIDNYESRH
jgi:hypothetical protein